MKYLVPNSFLLILIALTITHFGCKQRSINNEAIQISVKAESDPERRWKEEFDMMKNPYTGKIPQGIRMAELKQAADIPLKEEIGLMVANGYVFQGPRKFGWQVPCGGLRCQVQRHIQQGNACRGRIGRNVPKHGWWIDLDPCKRPE